MALNIKILMPLDHPPVTFPQRIVTASLTKGEDDMQKQNRDKHGLEDAEKRNIVDEQLKHVNIIK
jgi:hypothetical protein